MPYTNQKDFDDVKAQKDTLYKYYADLHFHITKVFFSDEDGQRRSFRFFQKL